MTRLLLFFAIVAVCVAIAIRAGHALERMGQDVDPNRPAVVDVSAMPESPAASDQEESH
jgi:hypothetical protein